MIDTLAALKEQNERTVWLLPEGEGALLVPPNTPHALPFVLGRVPARRIQGNLLYAVLGKDGYASYANWVNTKAQQQLAAQQALSRKAGEPEPFDDAPPDDERWRTHSLALERAAEDAVLEIGMISPTFAEAGAVLGPFREALVRELVGWGRQTDWQPPREGDEGGDSPNSPSANSEPP